MKTQDNIEDIVGSTPVSDTEISHPTYRPNLLSRLGKTVMNGSLMLLLGVIYLATACNSQVSPSIKTPESTNTPVATVTATPTQVPKYSLSFQAFHDYNGNGSMDTGEPALEGILNKTSAGECTTGADGTCEIVGVPAGDYKISITDNRDVKSFEKMRYILPSLSEIKTIGQGLDVIVDENEKVQESLGQGFATLPFLQLQVPKPFIWNYYDHDPSNNSKNYAGLTTLPGNPFLSKPRVGTYNGHTGLDYLVPEGTQIVAAAPGKLIRIGTGNDNPYNPNDIFVEISHDNGFKTTYHHLSEVLLTEQDIGKIIERGQIIGLSGSTGDKNTINGKKVPHLHLDLWDTNNQIDIYSDKSNDSVNYWIAFNSPMFSK